MSAEPVRVLATPFKSFMMLGVLGVETLSFLSQMTVILMMKMTWCVISFMRIDGHCHNISQMTSLGYGTLCTKKTFKDELLWKRTNNGQLSLKDAYTFKASNFQELMERCLSIA